MDLFDRALLFKSVVEQGSLTSAAQQLSISPSVVSKRLAELERHIGVQLLQRTTRRIALTEAGDSFYRQINHINSQWQTLLDETSTLGKEPQGKLTIAAPQPVLSRIITPLLPHFQHQYSGIKLRLRSVPYEQLPLFNADLSICRMLTGFDAAQVVGVPLCEYDNQLFASPNYIQKWGMPSCVEELIEHQCLIYDLKDSTVWRFASKKIINVTGHIQADSIEILIQAAIQHQGILYAPRMIIINELKQGQLVPILVDECSQAFQTYGYYQKMDYLPIKIRVFVDFLRQQLPALC